MGDESARILCCINFNYRLLRNSFDILKSWFHFFCWCSPCHIAGSLRTADFKVSRLDVSWGRVSTLPPSSLRIWIGRTPQRYLSLMMSHSSPKALHACCNALIETQSTCLCNLLPFHQVQYHVIVVKSQFLHFSSCRFHSFFCSLFDIGFYFEIKSKLGNFIWSKW